METNGNKKAEADAQTRQIHKAINNNKIAKEFRQLSSEELFKPITKRLDQQEAQPTTEPEAEVSDYEMNYHDQFNPFEETFKPDAPRGLTHT